MSFLRSAFTLAALGLGAPLALAQGTPAVSTVVAFSISNPAGNFVLGADGALYGAVTPATPVAGGIVYRSTQDGSSVTTLYQLSAENDGISPQAGLTLGSDGMLYGSTKYGRIGEATSTGTLFKVSQTGANFTVLHRFAAYTATNANLSPQNTDGAYPETELVEGADGFMYGVTTAGGPSGTGAVFKVARDGTAFKLLHAFAPDTDTTTSGDIVTVDGAAPQGQLVYGADGYLYGTASLGGNNGRGTVFRVNFDGTGFQVLKHFSKTTIDTTTALAENADGALPLAGLTDGNDGRFYGVASSGGITGHGVVFAITPQGDFSVLYTFDGTTGARPVGELLLGADGNLYGTTAAGGVTSAGAASTLGTVFRIARDGTGFARLHSFDGSVGSVPASRLVPLNSNVFFGTVQSGGRCGYGAMFRYSATGDTVTGNTRCGNSNNNNNNSGGGAGGPALVLLFGTLAWLRRRTR